MKKFLLFSILASLILGTVTVQAQEVQNDNAIKVEIVSPQMIESAPIYEGNVDIVVTNESNVQKNDLNCFLSIVDEDRKQSFPMDEFGTDSYQTRFIETLNPGESVTVTIPLRIMYVGNFKLIANVADYNMNYVYAANALPIHIFSNTSMHKGLVMGVAVLMPVALSGLAYMLNRKRGKHKEN